MTLGDIELPCAERDGEKRQKYGDVERRIVHYAGGTDSLRHDNFRVLQQNLKTGRNCLQLQRNIREDADHGDHRDEAAEQRALAVARRDKVRE